MNKGIKVFMVCGEQEEYGRFMAEKRFLSETGEKYGVRLVQTEKAYDEEREEELNEYGTWEVIRE